ncbi:MAG: PQQ-binding-like beta-propeller repeat protein [Bdellovibrionales bacterium]|nr:PQQ-binding-like beta-propeller repeat protein [Bdellovibrionales bacterium]
MRGWSLCWTLGILLVISGCASTPHMEKKRFIVKRHWLRSTPQGEFLQFRRMNRMRPVVTDKLVVGGNAIDRLVGYDRKSGKTLWARDLRDGVEGGAQLVDGRLYFGSSDGQFYCVNAETGVTIWSFPVRIETLGEPLVENDVVYFLAGNNVLYALDAKTGEQRWTYNRMDSSQLSIRGASRPLIIGNNLYVGFSDGSFVALDKTKGAVTWEQSLNQNKRFRDVDATPVADGDRIFVSSFDGALYCLDSRDGTVFWRVEEGGYAPVLIEKEIVYYGTSTGKMLALDKASGKVVWSKEGVRGVATSPVLYRGLLVYGESHGSLKMVDARTGQDVSEFKTGRGVTSAPNLDGESGDIYFMSANAVLYALQIGWDLPHRVWPWED